MEKSRCSSCEHGPHQRLRVRSKTTARIEARLEELGLTLPEPLQPPPGIVFPFTWVRVCGNRAYISGHITQNQDGSIAQPLGKVGADVSPEEGYHSARLVALAHLGSLKRALGDLDRVTAWLRVFAMVNAAPGFNETPRVTNGYSAHHRVVQAGGRDARTLVDRDDVAAGCTGEL